MNKEQQAQQLADHWKFQWSVMEVLIGGRSSVDMSGLSLKNERDARQFLKSYGFDPEAREDRQKLNGILIESIHFIESQLMPKEWRKGIRPPGEITSCHHPEKLLLWASGKAVKGTEEQRQSVHDWACAVLKVMHTISHLDDLQRLNNIDEAKVQIMGRFQKALFRDRNGKLWFGTKKHAIELEKVDWKISKSRNSMILKLLHKPANVAETIYDLLGVRIVTKNLSEAMIAVKFLREYYLVDFANTHPARARNNLIDTAQFQAHVEALIKMLENGHLSPENFQDMMMVLNTPVPARRSSNPHSSNNYRSIQLTCRQRVRYPNPSQTWQEKFSRYIDMQENTEEPGVRQLSEVMELIHRWCPWQSGHEISVFFPFEVQILDQEAARSIEKGDASHSRYKRAQIRSARRRILAKVLGIASHGSQGSKI